MMTATDKLRKLLDERDVPRVASRRRFQEFVEAGGAEHRASDLLAR